MERKFGTCALQEEQQSIKPGSEIMQRLLNQQLFCCACTHAFTLECLDLWQQSRDDYYKQDGFSSLPFYVFAIIG